MQVLYGRLTCTFYSNLNMLLMKKIERVNIMCNDSKTNSKCNCIAEILKVINILQSEVCPGDTCLETCTRAYFGPNSSVDFNTRPVTLYTCNGAALAMPVSNTPNEETTSNIFRVEKVDGCCATLRVLTYNAGTSTYTATNSFCTVNTDCCCSIICLADSYVEGV